MKHGTKLLGAAGFLAGAVIAITPLATAAETTPEVDVDAVVFQGQTTSLTCTPTIVAGQNLSTCGLAGGGTNGVPLVGGSGTFAFSTSAFLPGVPPCIGVSASDGVPPDEGNPDVEANTFCTITAGGTYVNVVCGTGAVTSGHATIAEGGGSDTYNVASNGSTGSGFVIVFVGGLGVVVAPNDVTETENGVATGETGSAIGVVQISPPPPTVPPTLPPTGLCVTAFDVLGILASNA